MAGYTKNFNLKLPSDIEFYDIEDFNENFEKIDQMAVKKGEGIGELTGGALSDRPEPGIAGRYYFAQDTGEIFLDTGEEWVLAAASQKEFDEHLAEKATQTQLGHVKVDGETIVMDENGVISGSQTAIVESGSNENGHYIRFADGTQICYHRINDANINIAELTDALYRSSAQTWVLPAQFITINAASVHTHTPFGWAGVSGAMSQTSIPFRLFATREITNVTFLYLFAIGRWK